MGEMTKFRKPTNYAKLDYQSRRHWERYAKRVENSKLMCQDCNGYGKIFEPVDPCVGGYWRECSWCRGTGKLTPWDRGLWLRMRRMEKGQINKL